MTQSYRLVDYSLRSGKFAERKMLCELMSRLRPFAPVQEYVYVGFGSIWFADYVLFHKNLGIREMISIERVEAHAARFEFNRPFANIDVRIGTAAEELLGLDWDRRQIVWLDYDDPLSLGILADLRTTANRARSGTMVAVTVQAERLFSGSSDDDDREAIETPEAFREEFGNSRTPADLAYEDLTGWGLAKTTRRAVREEIEDGVSRRKQGTGDDGGLVFRQVATFEYKDGARMTTVVGVFVDEAEESKFDTCGFQELEYHGDAADGVVRIRIPKLTPREMRRLDRLLPGEPTAEELGVIPPSDAEYYGKFYRYLPNYASFEP